MLCPIFRLRVFSNLLNHGSLQACKSFYPHARVYPLAHLLGRLDFMSLLCYKFT